MIRDFGNKVASDLYHRGKSKNLPRHLWKRAVHLLDVMESVDSFRDLKEQGFPPSVRLHPLKGGRKGEWAVDINKVTGWRITFCFIQNEFSEVKVENYHR